VTVYTGCVEFFSTVWLLICIWPEDDEQNSYSSVLPYCFWLIQHIVIPVQAPGQRWKIILGFSQLAVMCQASAVMGSGFYFCVGYGACAEKVAVQFQELFIICGNSLHSICRFWDRNTSHSEQNSCRAGCIIETFCTKMTFPLVHNAIMWWKLALSYYGIFHSNFFLGLYIHHLFHVGWNFPKMPQM
jgi:hypothetical protein